MKRLSEILWALSVVGTISVAVWLIPQIVGQATGQQCLAEFPIASPSVAVTSFIPQLDAVGQLKPGIVQTSYWMFESGRIRFYLVLDVGTFSGEPCLDARTENVIWQNFRVDSPGGEGASQ